LRVATRAVLAARKLAGDPPYR